MISSADLSSQTSTMCADPFVSTTLSSFFQESADSLYVPVLMCSADDSVVANTAADDALGRFH